MEELISEEEELTDMFEQHRKENRDQRPVYYYELGDVVENEIRFFGQQRTKNGNISAMCICPVCDETWRVNLATVRAGKIVSCGCKRN